MHARPAVQWSRVRATCGPLGPCACDLWTTRAVCVRPADHRSLARPSEATKPQDHMTTGLQPSEAITRSWSNKINHKINTSSVLLQVLIRVRVTELVYQIGFTTLFRSQGQENILAASSSKQQQAAAAASSSSKQATELISAYPHVSVIIDGTSPKLSW